jgi:single-stranded-DNA-specific exonuclease
MRWTFKTAIAEEKINTLAQALNVEKSIAQLLLQRGVETFEQAKAFFRPSLADLHDPYLMKDMDKAVARIEKAVAKGENILIFGDYDVDGTTAVSLVATYLKSFYPHVATYIPDRYQEGYGVSFKGIDFAEDNAISLIIALDCGIKSVAHVTYAQEKSIDFIICDHHLPDAEIPKAVAVLNPKQSDCPYPFKELCGCGIGFKLVQAIGKTRHQNIDDLLPYLDLVVVATAADIVPMIGENRVLAHFGLQVLNQNPRVGIKALLRNVKQKEVDIATVVFVIAPRINAAGRVKHGNDAVALLCETDGAQADFFASEIEVYNAERKNLDALMTQEALLQITANNEASNFTTVVFQENWHKGVIGIVASRLIETYYRPTLVFTKSGDVLAASARSVKGFDVYEALQACSEHLEQFGGHQFAAGLTLKPEKYHDFKTAFEKVVQKTIPPNALTPEISLDAEIDFDAISPKMLRILKQFEPFGPQNMTPVFYTKNVFDTGFAKPLGQQNEHLKLFLKQKTSAGITAIGFGLGHKLQAVSNKKPLEIAYCIDENHWQDKSTLQLRIKDLQEMGLKE